MKQTAVEYAVEKLEKFIPSGNQIVIAIILEESKRMEKQQIIDARLDGCISYSGTEVALISDVLDTEQYYNEQFKNK